MIVRTDERESAAAHVDAGDSGGAVAEVSPERLEGEAAAGGVGVSESPQCEPIRPDRLVLSPAEQAWVRNQQRRLSGQTSKYVPHQGARERARRLKEQMEPSD